MTITVFLPQYTQQRRPLATKHELNVHKTLRRSGHLLNILYVRSIYVLRPGKKHPISNNFNTFGNYPIKINQLNFILGGVKTLQRKNRL